MTSGSLTDVDGIRVGHHHRIRRGWQTGTTVVMFDGGATAGVDVRGGGPGTRETDLLRPEAMIERIHAVCLSGGSAFGLSAADGVMHWLEERHIGFPVGDPSLVPRPVVPIVPAAVIFDLGRGGATGNRPDATFGRRAAAAARNRPPASGSVGAGAGCRAGGLQGGIGGASKRLASGAVVAAIAVVNAAGRVIDPATGLPWVTGSRRLSRPSAADRHTLSAITDSPMSTLNTTIGVVATNIALSKAECTKLAAVAHDGLARAVRPAHSMFDGDTIFGVSTGTADLSTTSDDSPAPLRPMQLNELLVASAECFAIACTNAVVEATTVGQALAYRDACPSAFAE